MRNKNDQESLTIFSRGAMMLAEADTIQKAKELKSLALTAADWARRKGMGEDAIRHCRSYGLEAERKMGEMLRDSERAKNKPGPGRGKAGHEALPALADSPPTLAELGIAKNESANAQLLAELPRETFDQVRDGKKTRTQVKREQKEHGREAKRQANRSKIAAAPSLAKIESVFSTIVIDPPWDWGDEGDKDQLGRARPDYTTLSFPALLALPLAKLSHTDCHLYLWITNRSLPKGFALLEEWGFRYVTALTWPKPSFGMGNYFRGQTEHVLFGVKGSQLLRRKNASTLLPPWKRGQKGHSSKPVEFHEFVESCSPGPYLEMFSRCERKDWVAWGEGK